MNNFLDNYKNVFDSQGNIKACGRDKCKELIKLANNIEPEVFHGDLKTGYMNIASMKALYNKLQNK